MKFLDTIPVLPTADMKRDLAWYAEKMGFQVIFGDHMYAGLRRENVTLHLQWHADTEDDPLNGGSVVRFFVKGIEELFREFVERGTVSADKLQRNTPWGTHEFGFFDPNNNALFFVENA